MPITEMKEIKITVPIIRASISISPEARDPIPRRAQEDEECFAEVYVGCSNEDMKKEYDKHTNGENLDNEFNDYKELLYSKLGEFFDKDINEVKSMCENKSSFNLRFMNKIYPIENCNKDLFILMFNDIFSYFENYEIIAFHPEIIPITTIPETTITITTIPYTTISVPTSPIVPTSLTTYISTEVIDNASNGTIIYTKSSSRLSTGAICGIIIPCVAALLGITLAAALYKGSAVASSVGAEVPSNIAPNFIDTSLGKFNVVQELPIQKPVETIQPQPQSHIFEPQPVQQVVRPNYPINKIEPPVVNRTFQPVFIQQPLPKQVQMIPIQQVEMVPVQQVEMVPYQEIVPIQQIETVQKKQMVSIQQVEMVPNQEMVHVQQVEMVPHHEVVPVQHIRIVPNHEIVPIHQVGMVPHA